MDDEILTIGEKTAYAMAQGGELPRFKVRDQWRFRRADTDTRIGPKVQRQGDDPARKS